MKTIYISTLKKIVLLAGVMCLAFLWAVSSDSVSAASKITVKKGSKTSPNVKFIVTGENIIGIDVSEFYYYDDDDTDHEITKNVVFKKKSRNRWEASYKCSGKAYGEYVMMVTVTDSNGSVDTLTSDFFTYQSKNKVSKDDVIIAAAPRQAYIPDIGTFNSFYNIDKNGKELYLKKGETVNVDVLYRASDKKLVTSGNVRLKWGSKTISPSKLKVQSKKDSDGLYNIGAKFQIKTDSDMDGKIIAVYSGKKSMEKDTGVKLDSDGTAPEIKVGKKYGSKGTQYYNKPVTVPLSITEKNFEDSRIKVSLNGKDIKVSWKTSGTKHTTDIKLKEGQNVIEITGDDKAGNSAKKAKSATIIIDTANPVVSIEGFENGTGKGLKNGEVVPYPLNITVSDETSLADTAVELNRMADDGVTQIPITLAESREGNKVIYSIDDLTEDGYYSLTVRVVDSAKNKPDKKTVKSEGEKPYQVEKGIVSGGFTVNRQGSMYTVDDEELFTKPLKEVPDFIIYEYNKNVIEKTSVEIVDSIGTTELQPDKYAFEEIDSDDTTYQHKYKYTIYSSNFDEGYYSIQINSTSVAGDNGSLITRTENNSSVNKTIIIDKTGPEVVLFEGKSTGEVKVKIRDNNMDKDSPKLYINETEYPLHIDEDNSTSTNIVYTGDVGFSPDNARIVCSDIAGNETEAEGIVVEQTNDIQTIIIFIVLGVVAIALIVVTVVVIVKVKKQK